MDDEHYSFVPELRIRLLDRRGELQDELYRVEQALEQLSEADRPRHGRGKPITEEAAEALADEAELGEGERAKRVLKLRDDLLQMRSRTGGGPDFPEPSS